MADIASLPLAIVGFGPRGLGALESLFEQIAGSGREVHVTIFEPLDLLGAGPNFDASQSELCLLNIPMRALDIVPPPLIAPHIATFDDWTKQRYAADDFPERCEIGRYLTARFEALCSASAGCLHIRQIKSEAKALRRSEAGWMLAVETTEHGPFAEVLLAQGQPQTRPDDQLGRWTAHATKSGCALIPTYPANDLIAAARDWAGKTVAIRGLGLSTFDALRLMTVAQGGAFVDGAYVASGREPALILPFSLNGQPPAAKPATAALDAMFDPVTHETAAFEAALAKAVTQAPDSAMQSLCTALVTPATRILKGKTSTDIDAWLVAECEEAGAQTTQDALTSLKIHIEMALGQRPPSVGYVVGQIWRKWQNALRHGFNTVDYNAETAARIIAFDEGLKRYSYGPPVAASQELLALINAGVVSMRAVDDPDVALTAQGWQLSDDGESEIATVMVDAVLPSPDLSAVTDPLMAVCRSNNIISVAVENMGAKCLPDGQVVGPCGEIHHGLSMLGRLTLGSVIAADSLHDCFGQTADRWADGVVARNAQARRPTPLSS